MLSVLERRACVYVFIHAAAAAEAHHVITFSPFPVSLNLVTSGAPPRGPCVQYHCTSMSRGASVSNNSTRDSPDPIDPGEPEFKLVLRIEC